MTRSTVLQCLLFGCSLALAAAGMVLIARSLLGRVRVDKSSVQRRAGALGFGSGACLGTAGMWTRSAQWVLLAGLAMGAVLGLALAGIARQAEALSDRGLKGAPREPDGAARPRLGRARKGGGAAGGLTSTPGSIAREETEPRTHD